MDNETITDMMERIIHDYDVLGSWYTETALRRRNGILFSESYVDTSGTLLVLENEANLLSKFGIVEFFRPLTPAVWLSFFILACVHAIVAWWIDLDLEAIKKVENNGEAIIDGIYQSLYTTLGHFAMIGTSLEANRFFSRIVAIMWGFIIIIFVSAYTANLATFLIQKNSGTVIINSVEDIISNNLRACVVSGGAISTLLQTNYPKLSMVRVAGVPQIVDGILNGDCIGGIMAVAEAEAVAAENCELRLTGQSISESGGSFASSNSNCGPIVNAVFDSILLDLKEDGSFQRMWNEFLASTCPVKDPDSLVSSGQLTFFNFGGLFGLYLSGAGICIFLHFLLRRLGLDCLQKKKTAKEPIELEKE
jgi:ABC-type amino acid transport substrate-binding protein